MLKLQIYELYPRIDPNENLFGFGLKICILTRFKSDLGSLKLADMSFPVIKAQMSSFLTSFLAP